MNKKCTLLFSIVFLLNLNQTGWARAFETLGNKPLHEINYGDWPNLMPVINHPNRVYHIWVNGHESFYYQGKAEDLNDCLEEFSRIDAKVREVVIRPGPPAKLETFEKQTVTYNCELELMGGISRHLTTEDLGHKIWSPYPTLTVYVDDPRDLKQMKIPDGVELIELADLKKRYYEGLYSKAKSVRGWGAHRLARLDPYDERSAKCIAKLLTDEEWWVQMCAAGALSSFGAKAKFAIPLLKECLDTDHPQFKGVIVKSIETIEKANTRKEEKKHLQLMAEISNFLRGRQLSATSEGLSA